MNKIKQFSIYDWLAVMGSIFYFAALLINIDHFKAPHGDIYQYIREGHGYLSGRIPHVIHPQPLMSIALVLLQPLFAYLEFPYFATAKFMSITAASGINLITYLLLKKKTTAKFAFFTALLLSIHPISITGAFDTTNITLYSFFALTALFFIDQNNKKRKWFFVNFLIAFFIRTEAITLIISYSLVMWKKLKELRKDTILIVVSLLFIGSWVIFQTTHNINHNTAYGNYYLYEISERKFDVNNLIYSLGLTGAMFFPQHLSWTTSNFNNLDFITVILAISSIFLIAALIISKSTRAYGLYLLGISLIHSIFPAIEPRYFGLFLHVTTIGASILLFKFYRKHKSTNWCKSLLFAIIAIIFFYYLNFVLKHYSNNFSEYRNTAPDLNHQIYNWIFNNLNKENYQIIADENQLYYQPFFYSQQYLSNKIDLPINELTPGKLTIHLDQNKLTFIKLNEIKMNCLDSQCLLETLDENNKILLISGPEVLDALESNFWVQKKGTLLLKNLLLKKECLKELVVFNNSQLYRRIDELDLACYMDR